jgi:hypothetical protein
MEIRKIRQKYQPKNPPEVPSKDDVKTLRSSKSICNISTTNLVSFRQRIQANQRQKSLVSIARWALRDARKFDEKVKRLKGLIDGLEDISRIAGIIPQPQTQVRIIWERKLPILDSFLRKYACSRDSEAPS